MAFKASFKFSDSREFDVLTWRVKFNRDVDPKAVRHLTFMVAQSMWKSNQLPIPLCWIRCSSSTSP